MSGDSSVAVMGYVVEMSLELCQQAILGLSHILNTACLAGDDIY